MIRYTIFLVFLACLWVYAFRDWYISLCGVVLLTMMLKNDDMPTQLFGITGMNPWNVSLVIVTFNWAIQRSREAPPWNLSPMMTAVAAAYVGLLVVAVARSVLDVDSIPSEWNDSPRELLLVDYFVNPLKYLWATVLFADGCHSPKRARIAIFTIIALGLLYALMVVKILPLNILWGGVNLKIRNRINKEIGLHANEMAKVLVLCAWMLWAAQHLWRPYWTKIAMALAFCIMLLATAMCFSRAGYITFVAVGLVLGVIRWRRILVLGPVGVCLIAILLPSVPQRLLMGFEEGPAARGTSEAADWNTVTAGRTGNLWPPVVEQIKRSPILGHGRLGIVRTPAYDEILANEGTVPTTPHNGYLEILLDMGIVGLAAVMAFFLGTLYFAIRLVLGGSPYAVAIGGAGVAHSAGCLVNAISGGILIPGSNQGMVPTFCVLLIVVRFWCLSPSRRPIRRGVRNTVGGRDRVRTRQNLVGGVG